MSAGLDGGPRSLEQPAGTDLDSVAPGPGKRKFRDKWLSWAHRARDKAALFALWRADKRLRHPQAYGCEILAPGTHILANNIQWIPNVVASLPDGTQIRGVTLVAMLGSVNPSSMPDQLVSN